MSNVVQIAAKKPLSAEFPLRVGGRTYSFGPKPKVFDLHQFLSTIQATRRNGGDEAEVLASYLNSVLIAGDDLQPDKDDPHYIEQLALFFADLAAERVTDKQYNQVLDLVRQHFTGRIQFFLDFELTDAELEEQAAEIEEAGGDVDETPEKEVDVEGN